ncbi:MAG: SpoIIE family protein phosphatase, partial [Bacteroidia bacterium]
AIEAYDLFILTNDSISRQQNSLGISRLEMQYDFEKKADRMNEEQLKKDLKVQEERQKHKNVLFVVIGGLILAVCFSGFLYQRFKIIQKQKSIIEKQKEEVELQRTEAIKQKEVADSQRIIAEELKLLSEEQRRFVEEKNKEVTDSITYASRIQYAMLTSEEYIRKNFCDLRDGADYFIYYQPRNIVSGDFYWALSIAPIPGWDMRRTKKSLPEGKERSNIFYLCTADCTGHGVPGAFMSLLNISFLNENVIERNIRMPDDILNQQRKEIIKALNPTGAEDSKDGMDCVLCAFDFNKMVLHFSAANNPLWIVRNQQLTEYKADKMPVGKYNDEDKEFKSTCIDIEKGDIVYMFTDGFADQFGGPKGKKFKYKQLEELLVINCLLPMEEQKNIMYKKLEEWKEGLDQVDDVLLIGMRI